MRVLQVMGGLDRAGAEAMIMNIYRNIDRSQVQFDFIVNEREEPYAYENEIKLLGGRIYSIPKFNGINIYSLRKTWDVLLKSHPEWEILHVHYTSSAFVFLDITKKYGKKIISHSHIAGMEKSLNSYIKTITRYPLRYHSDYLMGCSVMAAKWMFGPKYKQTNILYNAIESENYIYNLNIRERIRNDLNLIDKTVIGHIGRFAEQKNHSYLIDIFYEYNKINSNSVLLLIGDGPLKTNIEAQVDELGITSKVIFLGSVNNVNELLQGMDLFLFPSLYEGLPVTLVEAQASGLPILASDTITNEIEITKLVTFKSLEENPKAWAQNINNLLIVERANMLSEIVQSGYDVRETSLKLQQYYLNITR